MEKTQDAQALNAFQLQKKYQVINGLKMAYLDNGHGDPIIFLHGNPTSGYIWRNVLPHVEDSGRCIVPDLMGMGDSDHFPEAADYTFTNNMQYLDALFTLLGLNENITFVVHDWGSVLAFHWARKHPEAVKGIVYMEAITRPRSWEEVPGAASETFRRLRTNEGEEMVLEKNSFIEFNLPKTILRTLSDEEMDAYRQPFSQPGETRRAMLSWARQLPLGGEPADMIKLVNENSSWLAASNVPKLFIEATPGTLADAEKQACLCWPNQTHIIVKGHHNLQEDSADEIGVAISQWLRKACKAIHL
ncbi:haloalkane dehalogenase [Dyadobacter chenwenxiniae]|uniref:Haloalkane dehalogenase n=1 Tax=Dyadobacter chenwenxiniae TaxID=2906456 RepID=A0A9X1PR82_9BACT|nr:haloalkane dehalogenase [Dyadobacter chenwenxiniae]MCF0064634.1 haloalkane dehalogenase [Dyadobacter chenwenxiniae]UON84310.1 haloalkane dehalogenase [Dyadobacter chenwenxiniae]